MLRWMCGDTKLDKIRNERILVTTNVGEIAKKIRVTSLKSYGHVMRKEELYIGKMAMEMEIQGRTKRGRPKRRWLDRVRVDFKQKGLSGEEVKHRGVCHRTSTLKWE